jgi:hypothetical protein
MYSCTWSTGKEIIVLHFL